MPATGSGRAPAVKRSAPRKKAAARKAASPRKKSAQRATGAKPARKAASKRAPAKKVAAKKSAAAAVEAPPAPVGLSAALETFLANAEMTDSAKVSAELARELVRSIEAADPPSVPALAREFRETVARIMPKGSDTPDDWTTNLAGEPGG